MNFNILGADAHINRGAGLDATRFVSPAKDDAVWRSFKSDSQLSRGIAALHSSLEQQSPADKIAHELVDGLFIKQSRVALLLHDAKVHERDTTGETERFDLIMGDKQQRYVQLPLQELHPYAHLFAQLGVQVAERFIQQQDSRLSDQRPCERDPLLLPTAQQRPRPIFETGHTDQLQCSPHAIADFFAGKFARFERKSHVLSDSHMGPDRVGLKYHTDVSLIGRKT